MKVTSPSTDIEKEILKLLSEDSAKSFLLQCGREYGFALEDEESPRATQLHLLSKEE